MAHGNGLLHRLAATAPPPSRRSGPAELKKGALANETGTPSLDEFGLCRWWHAFGTKPWDTLGLYGPPPGCCNELPTSSKFIFGARRYRGTRR